MLKKLFVTALLILAGLGAHAEVEPIEGSVESMSVELLVDDKGKGMVVIHDCKDCPRLHVNSETRFLLGGDPIPLDQAQVHARKGATVIYDLETKVVTRIRM
jgi:hypothetical protein